MKKRTLALCLTLVLCLGMLSLPTLAAGEFVVTDGVLTEYNGPGGDVVIPSGVVGIGEHAFRDCTSLTSVDIPNSVITIEKDAFSGCEGLTSVIIPDSVTTIGVAAFKDCTGLTSVTIPNSVTAIKGDSAWLGQGAFQSCINLTNVTIPDSVTEIGNYAFANCYALTNITIPGSVTSIGSFAFRDCYGLTSLTISDGVTSIGYQAFDNCSNLTDVTIPGSVTHMGEAAFGFCSALTNLTILHGVPSIGSGVFRQCSNLTTVTLPSSISKIEESDLSKLTIAAFSGCRNLTTVCGADGSYAQLWAFEKGKTFEATLPPAATPGKTAYAATQNIFVDSKAVEFQAYALKDENGNLANYVKLRDVAAVLNGTAAQFQVGWDGKVTITTKTPYTPNGTEMTTPYSGDRTYASTEGGISINGSSRSMDSLLLKDADGNGYTYFKLRDLGKALGFNVGWSAGQGIYIETNKPYDTKN